MLRGLYADASILIDVSVNSPQGKLIDMSVNSSRPTGHRPSLCNPRLRGCSPRVPIPSAAFKRALSLGGIPEPDSRLWHSATVPQTLACGDIPRILGFRIRDADSPRDST